MKECNYCIETDYGSVWLSRRTKDFLFFINEDWEDLYSNKNHKGGSANIIRDKMKQIEKTVLLLSEIAFSLNEDFNEF